MGLRWIRARVLCKRQATTSIWPFRDRDTLLCKPPEALCTRATAAFRYRAKGQLVTAAGDPVMGDKGAIAMPPGTVAISPDGTISSNGAVAGKLKLVNFTPGTVLSSAGETYYSAPPKTEIADTSSTVKQGMLESSNVNPVTSMVELITAQRSAEMMQRELSMYNSEMDKTATQDLPKISQFVKGVQQCFTLFTQQPAE